MNGLDLTWADLTRPDLGGSSPQRLNFFSLYCLYNRKLLKKFVLKNFYIIFTVIFRSSNATVTVAAQKWPIFGHSPLHTFSICFCSVHPFARVVSFPIKFHPPTLMPVSSLIFCSHMVSIFVLFPWLRVPQISTL